MKWLSVLVLLAVTACAQVEKVPVRVPVEVKVPVAVPCVTAQALPVAPELATKAITGRETDCELVDALLIERVQYEAYVEALEGVLAGCIDPAGS